MNNNNTAIPVPADLVVSIITTLALNDLRSDIERKLVELVRNNTAVNSTNKKEGTSNV